MTGGLLYIELTWLSKFLLILIKVNILTLCLHDLGENQNINFNNLILVLTYLIKFYKKYLTDKDNLNTNYTPLSSFFVKLQCLHFVIV